MRTQPVWTRLAHPARVWAAALRLRLTAQAAFPLNFLMRWLQSAFGAAAAAAVNLLLFAQVAPHFRGFTPGGLLCLAGCGQVLTACWLGLFIDALPRLGTRLLGAELDPLLLRPMGAQFQAAFTRPNAADFLAALAGAAEVAAGLAWTGGTPALRAVLGAAAALCAALACGYAVWLLIALAGYWLADIADLHEVFLSLQSVSATPAGVYGGWLRVFVTALPFGLAANVPADLLLGRPDGRRWIVLAAAAAVWVLIAQAGWRLALRRYRGGEPMTETTIEARGIRRVFRTPLRAHGPLGLVRHLLRPRWREHAALRGVDLHARRGEILGVLGPNGAGKTTLMRVLTGILAPSPPTAADDVRVLGFRPADLRPAFVRRIGRLAGGFSQMVQEAGARENLRFLAGIYGLPPAEWQPRLHRLAGRMDVSSLLDVPLRRLSLGERAKIELIAAVLHRPDVLFLDEPTLGLDPPSRAAVRTFVREEADRGATVLLCTHYLEDVAALATRIVALRNGEAVFEGTLADLRRSHAPLRRVTALRPDGTTITRTVPAAEVPAVVRGLLAESDVADLSVAEPPLEEALAGLYGSGGSGPSAPGPVP